MVAMPSARPPAVAPDQQGRGDQTLSVRPRSKIVDLTVDADERVRSLALFGSAARGTLDRASNMDVEWIPFLPDLPNLKGPAKGASSPRRPLIRSTYWLGSSL